MNHYLFLSSNDSNLYFPNNEPTNFTIELNENIYLPGLWKISLAEIFFKDEITEQLLICCDLCGDSIVRDQKHAVLRLIPEQSPKNLCFKEPIELDISRDFIKRIRVYIRTMSFEKPTFLTNTLTCTIKLKRLL